MRIPFVYFLFLSICVYTPCAYVQFMYSDLVLAI